jgi:hypothetical protein
MPVLCLRPNEWVLGDKFGEFLSFTLNLIGTSEGGPAPWKAGAPFPARLGNAVWIYDQGEGLKVFKYP